MNEEQPQIVETTEELIQILKDTREQLHKANQDLQVAQNNELMLWRMLGQQMLTQVEDG